MWRGCRYNTCHIVYTAESDHLLCSFGSRPGRKTGWHKEHIVCSCSATHISDLQKLLHSVCTKHTWNPNPTHKVSILFIHLVTVILEATLIWITGEIFYVYLKFSDWLSIIANVYFVIKTYMANKWCKKILKLEDWQQNKG